MKTVQAKKIYLLAFLSAISIILISLMKNAMELEDAEQAYYSQWWRLGYDDQPPLYTWLQNIVNSIFGVTKVSFSLLRALLFFSIVVVLYQFALKYIKDQYKALLVVVSLSLVPVFIDFTFRRLSHTSLLCLVILLTYVIVQQLIKRKTVLNYIWLGVIIGVGLLTKYNYILALGAFCLVLPFDENLRRIIYNKRIVITLALSVLIITPHVLWLLSHHEYILELQHSINEKTRRTLESGIPVISPILKMLFTLIQLIVPLLFVGLLLFLRKKINIKTVQTKDWLLKLLISQIIIFTLFFVIVNIKKVEARWLFPLLLPFFVLIPKVLQVKNINKVVQYGVYIFLGVLFVQTIRTSVEKILKIKSSVQYGFEPISDKLKQKYPQKTWVLPDVTYGGSVRLLNYQKEIITLDDFSFPSHKNNAFNKVIVVKNKANENVKANYVLVDSILSFGKDKQDLFFYTN